MKRSFFFGFIFIMLFSGCVSLDSTRKYYHPLSETQYAPKTGNVLLPIVEPKQLRRPYKVIGYMDFTSGLSEDFILDSVQFNARENGADAVILNQWEEEQELYTTWMPFGWDGMWYNCNRPGLYSRIFFYYPEYETYAVTTYKVKAEMIVFLDKETLGYTGILFEDIRNANFLEIGRVIEGSPADIAGLKKGDKVLSIGGYLLDKGLDDYLSNGPIFRVDEEVLVSYIRGGEEKKQASLVIASPLGLSEYQT